MIDACTEREWGALGRTFRDYNLYQAWAYGDSSAARSGSQVHRIIVRRQDRVIGMAQVCVKRIPFVGGGVAQAYWGPLWRSSEAPPHDCAEVLEAVRVEFADRRGLNLRLITNVILCPHDEAQLSSVFRKAGYIEALPGEAARTIRIDLAPSLPDLRAALEQKWRNGLNQAERNGIEITAGTDSDQMTLFHDLYRRMWQEKRFATGVDVQQIRELQNELPLDEKLTILIAARGGEPIAAHVSSTLGDTSLYVLGASNDLGRKLKASYHLQWKAVELAKQRGARWYDLGGVDREKNPGVYHFKCGMGGVDAAYAGPFVAPGRAASRLLAPLAERAYRVARRYWATARPDKAACT
jgi:hypothetical protein